MGPLLDPKVWPELYGTPSVSTRISIARPPSLPYEDSDVLVLSSRSTLPDSTMAGNVLLYLDLRLSLPVTSTSKVNWAFAGRRYTISGEGRGGGGDLATTLRYRWEHIIDSHGSGGPPDEGAVVKRLEGGKEVEVEIGVGLNPNTGKIEAYEEVWK
ncbi:hypothetical protein ID866_5226 [Astraeus odoratus]|nr:hypothetical protein ID866_5226 [Astraeus odoratus]